MNMKIIKSEKKLCSCCMEVHEVKTVCILEEVSFKNTNVKYEAVYSYCDRAKVIYMDDEQIKENDLHMKNAYKSCMVSL